MQPQVKSNSGHRNEGGRTGAETSTAENLLEGARNTASGVVSSIRDGASQFMDKAQDVASDAAERAQEYGGTAIKETSTLIRRYPAQSLLIGFGAGVVLGMVIARR